MRVNILQACLEETLGDVGLPLEFETIALPQPACEPRLPAAAESAGNDTWNLPAEGTAWSTNFDGPIDMLVEPVKDVDYLVMHTAAVTRDVLAAGKRLRVIACARGGPVNVDVKAATDYGVPVIYAPGRNARAVAEFIMGMMLAFDRNIVKGWDGLRQGRCGATHLYDYDAMSPGFRGQRPWAWWALGGWENPGLACRRLSACVCSRTIHTSRRQMSPNSACRRSTPWTS